MGGSVHKQLQRAAETGGQVVLVRRHLNRRASALKGVVVDVGPHWLVMAELVDHAFDGWQVVRVRDVDRVVAMSGRVLDYAERVFAASGGVPPLPEGAIPPRALKRKAALVHLLFAGSGIVGIHEEGNHPDAMRIGAMTGSDGVLIGLQEIDTAGRWRKRETLIQVRKVSRVTIGGPYQDALAEHGDRRRPLRD